MKTSYLLRIVLLLFVIYCLNSCQEDKFNDIPYVQENEDIPIKSLDNSRGVTDGVTNGSCVIGVIQYCGNKFGRNIYRDEILSRLQDYAVYDSDNNLRGFFLNSYEWDTALKYWFDTTYPSGQNDVIASVVNKKLVCCRLASDNAVTHAVVLVGLDDVKRQFLYYDPVYGGEENRIAYYKIYDPRIINSLISPDL